VINLQEISVGDQVTIRDQLGNLVIGTVEGGPASRWIEAFDTSIPFARLGGSPRKWHPLPHVSVVGHLPAMF
jgi:hypothetical protein